VIEEKKNNEKGGGRETQPSLSRHPFFHNAKEGTGEEEIRAWQKRFEISKKGDAEKGKKEGERDAA